MPRFKIRFHVSIVTAIVAVVAAVTLATLVTVWLASSRAAEQTAATLFAEVARRAAERVDNEMGDTLDLAALGAAQGVDARLEGDGLGNPLLPFLFNALDGKPALYSLYYGFADGGFLQVVKTRGDERILAAHRAPPEAAWIVRAITGEGDARVQTWSFLDAARKRIGGSVDERPAYDPRSRPWYATAQTADAARLSPPYLFNSLKEPGITASRALPGGKGVFGVDITLAGLSHFVGNQTVSENGGVLVYGDGAKLLAASRTLGSGVAPLSELKDAASPLIQAVVKAAGEGIADVTRRIEGPHAPLLLRLAELKRPGAAIGIAVVAPFDDFTSHIHAMQLRVLLLVGGLLLVVLPASVLFSKRMGRRVGQLAEDAERVRHMDFGGENAKASRIIEFDNLAQAFGLMKTTLAGKTEALALAQDKLARIVDLGIAMSSERDTTKLMDMILLGAKELTNADGGTLYIRDDESNTLRFQILRNDTLKVALGGTGAPPANIPPVALFDAEGRPNHRNVVSHAIHSQQTLNIADAYDSTEFDFSGTKVFDQRNNYRSKSFLTVPLKPRGGDIIGALQLINARPPGSDEVIAFDEGIQRFVEALAAQAATALYNRELLLAQERLMDAMIQLVAGAIDAKSPYTGGHCERVPELSVMLAEEACKVTEGPLAGFAFDTDEQWREFRIGAWLHDCGKVTTPEYVVDKATKLETIHNRIHEVRTRFEVLWRDAEIAHLKGEITADELTARHDALKADFAFVADCNLGGEFMAPELVERLKAIAGTTWTRHFDDRLGLAHEELKRYQGEPEPLPVEEALLADKPHHRIPRSAGLSHAYDGLNFKVRVPENLYDFGEVYNLCVGRGTLVEEERFKINEHIMQTILMLERLPFPKHLKRVPEYAGAHHETLIGTGYPRKLTKDELSVPARITAIADIFEALTASDRPYKKPKTLSECVKILSFFKKDGHIDPDLFELFLTSGVYKSYAERYLLPEQIDEVDVGKYLTPKEAAATPAA